jgi:DNA polymerase alpha-associated DNA helicase A
MQLPPTILSLDKHRKSKDKLKSGDGRKVQEKSQKKAHSAIVPAKGPGPSLQTVSVEEQESFDIADSGSEDSDCCSGADDDNVGSISPTAEPSPPVTSNRQTRPEVLRPPRNLETTLFDRLERMYGPSIKRMLTVQYR